MLSAVASWAQEDLAKQSQNPLGKIISAPFENNFNFGIGPSDATAYVLNMKPVYVITSYSIHYTKLYESWGDSLWGFSCLT